MRRPELFFGTDFSLDSNNASEIALSKGFFTLIYFGNQKDFIDQKTPKVGSAIFSYSSSKETPSPSSKDNSEKQCPQFTDPSDCLIRFKITRIVIKFFIRKVLHRENRLHPHPF